MHYRLEKCMDYKGLKVAELRSLAKEMGIVDADKMRKPELVELLENVEKMKNVAVQAMEGSKKAPAQAGEESRPAAAQSGEEAETQSEEESKPAQSRSREGSKVDAERRRPSQQANQRRQRATRTENGRPETARQENARQESGRSEAARAENGRPETARADNGRPETARTENGRSEAARQETARTENGRSEAARQETARTDNGRNDAAQTPQSEQPMIYDGQEYNASLDSGSKVNGILEVMPEGFGFIRSDNYMPGDKDIYVSPAQIRRFGLKTGDIILGPARRKMQPNEKFQALLYIESVNGMEPSIVAKRKPFESLTPIFPEDRIRLDYTNAPVSLRIVDLFSPIGKGQRGMIVSPPKAGKTTLLKQIAKRISVAYPEIHLLVLLIDERPEEVTDIKESIVAQNAEVIYSTFDELPEHHKRVSEMVIERAKRMVECGKDVVILLDSLTRLARAYNLTVSPSGRTLSGGLDPAALHMPKKFFGAARNMREGGSLTILATALVETGSRMDDVVFEEFKGTGNMELVLNRSLSERRVFPAIDIAKSGTRRDDLLLSHDEKDVLDILHQQLRGAKIEEATEEIVKLFGRTRNNLEFLEFARKMFGRNVR